MSRAPDFDILPFGENGWIAQFIHCDEPIALALYANAIAKQLRHKDSVIDAVAGIDSCTLRFNQYTADAEAMRAILHDTIQKTQFQKAPPPIKKITIPVCYGGTFGPDFDDLCTQNKLTRDTLIKAHTSRAYRVMTIGFAPGFAYMGPLDEQLYAPRLTTPRQRVAAGSVAVANIFTGVYSLSSPGGWRIIGRTPKRLFDPESATPFIFEAGTEIRFSPISEDEFTAKAL